MSCVQKGGQSQHKISSKPSENVAVRIFGNDTNKHEEKEIAVRNIFSPLLLRM